MYVTCKKMEIKDNAKTYLVLLPEEILNLIYKKLFFFIITSREFQIAQSWMNYKIISKRLTHSRYHYSNYFDG
jgi:hypothetical protein